MDYQDTLQQWESYFEKLEPLQKEVTRTFKVKGCYDEKLHYYEKHYEANDDTVFLIKLSEKLTDICNFMKSHIEVLSHRVQIEEEQQFNVEQSFESWKRNLCPILMRNVQRTLKSPSYDSWGTYDEVSEFLVDRVMSYEGTQQAILSWQGIDKLKQSA